MIKILFQSVFLSPNIGEYSGVFLENVPDMDLYEVGGEKCTMLSTKLSTKKGLHKRIDSPWRTIFEFHEDVKPEWRALYKPPLTKRIGDLQWRIVHGIVAS